MEGKPGGGRGAKMKPEKALDGKSGKSIEGGEGLYHYAAASLRRTPRRASRLVLRAAVWLLVLLAAGLFSQAVWAAQGPTLPTVAITAMDPDASVMGPNTGQFIFMRTAGTDKDGNPLPLDPLTVTYTIGGTAVNGTDYTQIDSTVTFAQDSTTAALIITPLAYNPPSGERTVVLTLATDNSYQIDAGQGSATVTIQEEQPPPPCTQECDPATNPSCCKNQLLIDAYDTACNAACKVAVNTVNLIGQACYDACNFADSAYRTICGWTTKTACEAGSLLCNDTYDVCTSTGFGSGCNITYSACVSKCWVEHPVNKRRRNSCLSDCSDNRDSCIDSNCGYLTNNCFSCSGSDPCDTRIGDYCSSCESVALNNCEGTCDSFAPPCILKKEEGESCTGIGLLSDCDSSLSCRPDPTGFENLDVNSMISQLLPLPNMQTTLDNLKAAATDPQTYLNVACLPGNTDCVCQQPLLQLANNSQDSPVSTALDIACATMYRPGRQLMAWLANQDISLLSSLRQSVVDKLTTAGAPQALIDTMQNRFQELAFTYGRGASYTGGVGMNAERGTVYDGSCYGCYLKVCGHAKAALDIDGTMTKGVHDVTGRDEEPNGLDNLQEWSLFAGAGGEFDVGVDVGLYGNYEFEPPEAIQTVLDDVPVPTLNDSPSDVFSNADVQQVISDWNDYVNQQVTDMGGVVSNPSEFPSFLNDLITRLIEEAIPRGDEKELSVGVGAGPPVNVTGGLCYTWVKKALCLSLDTSAGNECLSTTPIVNLPGDYPPVAVCRPTVTVAAAAPPACNASASIDGGSYAPDGGSLTLTQNPSGPYSIGTTTVTLTATEGDLSDTCQGDVNVLDQLPPDLTCPSDVTTECTGNEQAFVDTGTATAVDCSSYTVDNPQPAYYPVGTTEVNFSATDHYNNTGSCSINVTVQDTVAPTITAPQAVTAECTSPDGTPVALGTPVVHDVCDPSPQVTNDAPDLFPLGSTTVTWTAKDRSNNQNSATQQVTVEDTTPPVVQTSLKETLLWPVNQKFVDVGLSAGITEVCDPNPKVSVSVFSNEANDEATGSGNFSPDAEDVGLDTLQLRNERKGDGDGRVYLIAVTATDASGNVGVDCTTVVVPHDDTQASISSVDQMAADAKAFCLANGGSAPAGYFDIGSEPAVVDMQ